MKRVERLMKMLMIMHTKKLVSVDFLANEFGISTRTAYRDIKALAALQLTVMYEQSKGCLVVNVYCGTAGPYTMKLLPAAVKNEFAFLARENSKPKHKR